MAEFAWKDISVSVLGVVINGITNIKMKAQSEDEYLYGRGDKPLDIQSGNKKYEGSMTVNQSVLDEFIAVATVAGVDVLDLRFDVIVNFEKNNLVKTSIVKSVKFQEWELDMSQGDKKADIAMPFMGLDIEHS